MGLRGGFAISYNVVLTHAGISLCDNSGELIWGPPLQVVSPGSLAVPWILPAGPQHCPSSHSSLSHLHVLEKHCSACCAGLVLQVVFRREYQTQTVIIF